MNKCKYSCTLTENYLVDVKERKNVTKNIKKYHLFRKSSF